MTAHITLQPKAEIESIWAVYPAGTDMFAARAEQERLGNRVVETDDENYRLRLEV